MADELKQGFHIKGCIINCQECNHQAICWNFWSYCPYVGKTIKYMKKHYK